MFAAPLDGCQDFLGQSSRDRCAPYDARRTKEGPVTAAAHRLARRPVDKVAARRSELAAAALKTLAERGYAQTGLRDIAQNSEFSHGVLHYYFADKTDLITYCVREYKTQCATRYDEVVATATTAPELAAGFLDKLAETLVEEAPLHPLWYDLRNQSMFERPSGKTSPTSTCCSSG